MEPADVLITPPLMNPIPDSITTPNVTKEIKVASTCPWGKIKTAEVVSLNDVMSEQLISSLVGEEKKIDPDPPVYVDDFIGCGEEVLDCSDDSLLAKILQSEYDREHDEILRLEESKFNGESKVKVTFEKFRYLPAECLTSDEDPYKEYNLEQNHKRHWQVVEKAEKAYQAVGKSGVSRQGNVTTTKHDPTVCGRRNVGKLLELHSSITTGDAGQFDMKLSNNVFNSLKVYSKAESKRSHRLHEKKEKSTTEKALDEKTKMILYRMLNDQTIDSFTGCICTGKEACVYHALGHPKDESTLPQEYAVKVFKTTLNEFQNRGQYIKDDHRFKHRFSNQNPRKVIHMWAEKEMRNLQRMGQANIPCPETVILREHVLVMSFIGKDSLPAPKIKDVDLPFECMTIIYEQTFEIMKTLYSKCQLVHADLSEYNLLWYEGKTWVIDVSQSVEITHSQAEEFLLRDCTNISSFFDKKGVLNVPTPEELFFQICGKYPKESKQAEK